jgi:AcrR family transcriptional regulator
MAPSARVANRGPGAAADNRLALLAAAGRVFTERGYHVPLSAIAREAGVGQGVLYRHFPTRLDLALAVFEAHLVELERLAAEPGEGTFDRLWSRLVELTVAQQAFIEAVVDARRNVPDLDLEGRVRRLVDSTLPPAQAAGLVRADLTSDDLMLITRMVFGIAVTAADPASARPAVDRALALILVQGRPAG